MAIKRGDYTITVKSASSTTSVGVPATISNNSFAASWDDPLLVCAVHVTGDPVEYIDGRIFSHCTHCNARIEITRLPGGLDLIRLRELVADAATGLTDGLSEAYYGYVKRYQGEKQALEEAFALLSLFHDILEQEL